MRRCLGNLATHQDSDRLAVHDAHHLLEHVESLGLVDYQRVFLLITGVLYALSQLVHLTQVLLPVVVDGKQHDSLLPLFGERLAVGVDSLHGINNDAEGAFAVGNGHADELRRLHATALKVGNDVLDTGFCNLAHMLHLAVECLDDGVIQDFLLLAVVHAAVFFLVERGLDGVGLENLHLEVLVVVGTIFLDHILNAVIERVDDVQTDALTNKCVVAAGVDHLTLGVHHVVILE